MEDFKVKSWMTNTKTNRGMDRDRLRSKTWWDFTSLKFPGEREQSNTLRLGDLADVPKLV